MSTRRRVERLWRKNSPLVTTLVCPECKAEFTAYGDVALDLIVAEWVAAVQYEGPHETPEDIRRILEHEHDSGALVEKTSGAPFLSTEFGGGGSRL